MSPKAYVSAEVAVGHRGVEVRSGKAGGSFDVLKVQATPHAKKATILEVWHDGERWNVRSGDGVQWAPFTLPGGPDVE